MAVLSYDQWIERAAEKRLKRIDNDKKADRRNELAKERSVMNLGAFSISLTVKDLQTSIDFYEKLGFVQFGGDCGQGWTILKNGDHIIGLFQGMFDKNMLTFNPGWNQDAQEVDSFDDVRVLQRRLKDAGVSMIQEVDESTSGPGSIMLADPDGNPILIDQHR